MKAAERASIKDALIGAAIVAAIFVLICMLCPLPTKPADAPAKPSQIILSFDRTVQATPTQKVQYFASPTKIEFGLTPLDPATAPLPVGAMSICYLSNTPVGARTLAGKDAGQVMQIKIRCGQNDYLFTTLAVMVDK